VGGVLAPPRLVQTLCRLAGLGQFGLLDLGGSWLQRGEDHSGGVLDDSQALGEQAALPSMVALAKRDASDFDVATPPRPMWL
jgi:hypothetical protein